MDYLLKTQVTVRRYCVVDLVDVALNVPFLMAWVVEDLGKDCPKEGRGKVCQQSADDALNIATETYLTASLSKADMACLESSRWFNYFLTCAAFFCSLH